MWRFVVEIERTYGELRNHRIRRLLRKLNPLPKFKGLLLRRLALFLKLLWLALRWHPLGLIIWVNPRHHLWRHHLLSLKIQPSRLGDPRDKEDLLRFSKILSCRGIRIKTSKAVVRTCALRTLSQWNLNDLIQNYSVFIYLFIYLLIDLFIYFFISFFFSFTGKMCRYLLAYLVNIWCVQMLSVVCQ